MDPVIPEPKMVKRAHWHVAEHLEKLNYLARLDGGTGEAAQIRRAVALYLKSRKKDLY